MSQIPYDKLEYTPLGILAASLTAGLIGYFVPRVSVVKGNSVQDE